MSYLNHNQPVCRLLLATIAYSALAACAGSGVADQNSDDARLENRVVAALANASDLPANALAVTVDDGIVILTGSVVCDDCGGNLTPGGSATVQQSLGAVVRAVPGVERVEFDLQYQSGAASGP